MPDRPSMPLVVLAPFAVMLLLVVIRIGAIVRERGWTRTLRPLGRYLLAVVLMVVSAGGMSVTALPLWLSALSLIFAAAGLLLSYNITLHVLENTQIPFHATPAFWPVTVLVGITIVLDAARGDNRGNFVLDAPFVPTLTYVATAVLTLGIVVYLEACIVGVYGRSLRRNHALTSAFAITYTLRRSLGLAAFSISTVNFVINIVQILAIATGRQSVLLSAVFQHANRLAPPSAVTMLLISVAPTWLYTVPVQTIHWWMTHRRREQYALLAYLQQTMLHVVPTVPHLELADPYLNYERALAEIADAREVLWSDADRTTPITPDTEAARRDRLRHAGHQYGADRPAGRSLHRPIGDERMIEHNLAVARALKQLEQHAASAAKDDRHADA